MNPVHSHTGNGNDPWAVGQRHGRPIRSAMRHPLEIDVNVTSEAPGSRDRDGLVSAAGGDDQSPPNGVSTLAVLRIEPSPGWAALKLHDLWEYRELLYYLTWRDIKVRYKQTVLGAAWAIIQPFFTMLIFSLFFGRLAKIPSEGVPYPLFSYAALVPWTFFANGLTQSANSLVGNANLIRKVYFPRLAIPLSTILSALADFGIAAV